MAMQAGQAGQEPQAVPEAGAEREVQAANRPGGRAQRAEAELKVIRQLMERPIRYSTMSGLSGILAGCAALAGLAAGWQCCYVLSPNGALAANVGIWAGVFVVALAATLLLTRLREKARGMPFWSSVKRRILVTVAPPFIASAGLAASIVFRHMATGSDASGFQGMLIPAIWMLFYGIALWQIGQFSPVEVKVLGAAFILAGLITGAWFTWYPVWTMGITFGGFHIVYGIIVRIRHGG